MTIHHIFNEEEEFADYMEVLYSIRYQGFFDYLSMFKISDRYSKLKIELININSSKIQINIESVQDDQKPDWLDKDVIEMKRYTIVIAEAQG